MTNRGVPLILCALVGCAGTGPDLFSAGDAAAGAGGGDAPLGPGSDAGSAGSGMGRVDGLTFADAAGAAPAVLDAACATQSLVAERLPLDLIIMLDSSGSMLDGTGAMGTGQSKWDAVKAALVAFLNDPRSSGMGVGLQYFPQPHPGVPELCQTDAACGVGGPCYHIKTCTDENVVIPCEQNEDCRLRQCVPLGVCSTSPANDPGYCIPVGSPCGMGVQRGICQGLGGFCLGHDTCEVPAYAAAAVPVMSLPGAAAALTSSLNMRMPTGLTPTSAALSGAIAQAQMRARQSAGSRVAVLLATDGFPSTCMPTDIPGISALAQAARAGMPSVPTFVVGVFTKADEAQATTNLTAIAQAGGTARAFVINTEQNVTQAFLAALNEIRTAALACEYKVPPPAMGQIDFGKVNVQFTGGAGGMTTIPFVRDKAACHPTLGGWYYDVNPATGTPTKIIACDNTCATLKADSGGRVDIVIGCKSLIVE